jgi:hypothetical protein
VVLNDHIRSPIKTQTKALTYIIHIDIFPHILEDQCFAGHIQEYSGIIVKARHQRNYNADMLKGNRRKTHVPCKSRPDTKVARTPDLARSPPAQGGGEAGRLGKPTRPLSSLMVAWWHAKVV